MYKSFVMFIVTIKPENCIVECCFLIFLQTYFNTLIDFNIIINGFTISTEQFILYDP